MPPPITTTRAWVGSGLLIGLPGTGSGRSPRLGSVPDLGDVDADLLDLRQLGQDPVGKLASEAALLHPSERGQLVPVVVRLVDEDRPAADPLAEQERRPEVARE